LPKEEIEIVWLKVAGKNRSADRMPNENLRPTADIERAQQDGIIAQRTILFPEGKSLWLLNVSISKFPKRYLTI
jgi:hypothetical protein